MESDLLGYVRTRLNDVKGEWPGISAATEVPYDTITKIAQGTTKDPRVSSVQRLANYFREREAA